MKVAQLEDCRRWMERARERRVVLDCQTATIARDTAADFATARSWFMVRDEDCFRDVAWSIHGRFVMLERKASQEVVVENLLASRVVAALLRDGGIVPLATPPSRTSDSGPPPSLENYSLLGRDEAGDDA